MNAGDDDPSTPPRRVRGGVPGPIAVGQSLLIPELFVDVDSRLRAAAPLHHRGAGDPDRAAGTDVRAAHVHRHPAGGGHPLGQPGVDLPGARCTRDDQPDHLAQRTRTAQRRGRHPRGALRYRERHCGHQGRVPALRRDRRRTVAGGGGVADHPAAHAARHAAAADGALQPLQRADPAARPVVGQPAGGAAVRLCAHPAARTDPDHSGPAPDAALRRRGAPGDDRHAPRGVADLRPDRGGRGARGLRAEPGTARRGGARTRPRDAGDREQQPGGGCRLRAAAHPRRQRPRDPSARRGERARRLGRADQHGTPERPERGDGFDHQARRDVHRGRDRSGAGEAGRDPCIGTPGPDHRAAVRPVGVRARRHRCGSQGSNRRRAAGGLRHASLLHAVAHAGAHARLPAAANGWLRPTPLPPTTAGERCRWSA